MTRSIVIILLMSTILMILMARHRGGSGTAQRIAPLGMPARMSGQNITPEVTDVNIHRKMHLTIHDGV